MRWRREWNPTENNSLVTFLRERNGMDDLLIFLQLICLELWPWITFVPSSKKLLTRDPPFPSLPQFHSSSICPTLKSKKFKNVLVGSSSLPGLPSFTKDRVDLPFPMRTNSIGSLRTTYGIPSWHWISGRTPSSSICLQEGQVSLLVDLSSESSA